MGGFWWNDKHFREINFTRAKSSHSYDTNLERSILRALMKEKRQSNRTRTTDG